MGTLGAEPEVKEPALHTIGEAPWLHPGPVAPASRVQSWCWLPLSPFPVLFCRSLPLIFAALAKLFLFIWPCTVSLPLCFPLPLPLPFFQYLREPGGMFRILSSTPLRPLFSWAQRPQLWCVGRRPRSPQEITQSMWGWPPLIACSCAVLDTLTSSRGQESAFSHEILSFFNFGHEFRAAASAVKQSIIWGTWQVS